MRMINSANDTADGYFSVLAYVDNDDPYRYKYPGWVHIGEPKHLGPAYRALYEMSTSDIVMMCADDLIFRSKGWDTKVQELMPKDLVGLVSFDDLGNKPKKKENGHPFIGRKLIEKIGYICHPTLNHSCVDSWIVQIAQGLKRFYRSDEILIEHMHPKYEKGENDSTYDRNDHSIRLRDGAIYRHSADQIKKTIESIKESL